MPSYSPELLPTVTRHSCGRRVRWCRSRAGLWQLLDAEPQADGRVVLVLDQGEWIAETRRGYRAIALRQQGLELYRHHRCEP